MNWQRKSGIPANFPDFLMSASVVSSLRATFRSGVTRDVKWRRTQLEALKRLAFENQEEIIGFVCFSCLFGLFSYFEIVLSIKI